MQAWVSPKLLEALGEVIDTAIALASADFGNIQLLDTEGRLRIVAQRNFPAWWLDYWETVEEGQGACGTALAQSRHVIVDDVERSPLFVGTPALDIQRRAGVRAVHSIPLCGKSGQCLGMFSTHFRAPHTPASGTLHVLELLTNNASTLIEHARDEHLLRESQLRLTQAHELLESVTAGTSTIIAAVDRELRYTYFNRAHHEELFRLTGKRTTLGMSLMEVLAEIPEERDKALELWHRALSGEIVERRIMFGDPRHYSRWYRTRHTPIRTADGQIVGAGEVSTDITDRFLVEQELQLRAAILSRVEDGVNVVSASDGRILYVNRAMEDMFGYTTEEMLGQPPAMLNASSGAGSPEAVAADIFSALQTTSRWQGDVLNRRRDGSPFWTNATITRHDIAPWGTVWLGVQRDIGARKQQENELARQRALLESAMNTANVMLALLDPAFNFVWVNMAYAQTCAMAPEAMIGKNHFFLYPGAEIEAIFRQVRDTAKGVFYKDKPFEFPDQPERGITYWDWSLDPIMDDRGEVSGLVFALRETTQFKRIELALAASEAHYRSLVEQVPDGIFVADASGRYTNANETGAAMLGYTCDEIIGMSIADIIFPDEARRLPEEIARFADGSVVRSEWRFRRKDGSSFIGEVLGRQLADGRLQGVLRDITGRKQAENARLEVVARQRDTLIQEVHHRIKNHLHGVMGLLSAQTDAYPALGEPLAKVTAQIKAIAAVYGLQAFWKPNQVELGQMVALLVNGAVGPVPVECRSALAAPVHLAETVSVPLALVINELINNALKHLDRPDPNRPVKVTLASAGSAVKLEVRGGPAHFPADFDFAGQKEIGLGLELVGTLLPGSGAQLSFVQLNDETSAELWLEAPAIRLP